MSGGCSGNPSAAKRSKRDPGTQTKRASIRSRILPIASAKKGVPIQLSFSFQSDLQVFLVKPHPASFSQTVDVTVLTRLTTAEHSWIQKMKQPNLWVDSQNSPVDGFVSIWKARTACTAIRDVSWHRQLLNQERPNMLVRCPQLEGIVLVWQGLARYVCSHPYRDLGASVLWCGKDPEMQTGGANITKKCTHLT